MSLKAIDISSHNPVSEAANSTAQAVIVKGTQGTYYVNPSGDAQYQLAKKNGKLLGFYHYAGGGDPVAEADYFYKNCKNYFYEAIPCLDWESYQNAAWGDKNWCTKFVNRIHDLTGVWCLLYTGLDGIQQNTALKDKCGLWFAGYPTNAASWTVPNFPYNVSPWKAVTIWQFTSGGGLDRNIAYLDKTSWGKIANPKGSSKPNPTPAPKPPVSSGYSTKGKTLEQMATDTANGKVGNGAARIKNLGNYYTGVQAIINQRAGIYSAASVVNTLASEVIKGQYGTGDARKKLLGTYYNNVQKRVNALL